MEIDKIVFLTNAKYHNYCEDAISSSDNRDSSDIKKESTFFICILNLEFYFTKLYQFVNSKNKKEFFPEQWAKIYCYQTFFWGIIKNDSSPEISSTH